ncbi:putative U5 snRNP complex subunit [Piedraia hortae CBS 480.64]|uniref:Putative U5 snRNP complex subunit n=1 Tax=Piedraia hortae CBS 480.64 TaxID=1314780 RepID=A0A6A7BWC7_9PEZI|nr:putative U5 snRNP complex subunit [Piedraia hortae CBS 480.64]
MSREKRAASSSFSSTQVVKRQRSEAHLNGQHALVHQSKGPKAPVMELNGHEGEVFCARFSPSGEQIASGAMDRDVFLWHASGECSNYGVLRGHKGAVLDLQWSRDGQILYSASADTHIANWDAGTGQRIRQHAGHTEVVNCVDVAKRGEEFLVSGSDDGYLCLWDPRQKIAVENIDTDFPVTAVALAEAGHELYSGGIDNVVKVWDIRMQRVAYTLAGHADTVTSLAVSPDGQSLLSYSHDSTARTWDVRPFAPANRQIRVFDGAPAGLEKNLFRACWADSEGNKIAAGGGDGTVTVWEVRQGKMVQKLPGHKGSVNDVRCSGNAVVSASSDGTILLGYN